MELKQLFCGHVSENCHFFNEREILFVFLSFCLNLLVSLFQTRILFLAVCIEERIQISVSQF